MIIEPRSPGETIRAIRRKRGMSQKELADKLGVTISSISRYEGGSRQMTVNRFEQILDELSAEYTVRY